MRKARCTARPCALTLLAGLWLLAMAPAWPAHAQANDSALSLPAQTSAHPDSTYATGKAGADLQPAHTPGAATAAPAHGILARIRSSYLGRMYIKGGVLMHPLLLCALFGIVLIVGRLWTLWRARINTRHLMMDVIRALRQEGPRAALRVCESEQGPIANMLHAGLLRADRGPEAVEKAIHTAGSIEMAFLERGLLALATISNIAPLLGFLGTVTGMINVFAAISAANEVSARIVAKGIEQALITTAAGLIIAVPISACYAYFVLAIDRFVLEMESASSELVDELMDIDYRKSTGQPVAPFVKP